MSNSSFCTLHDLPHREARAALADGVPVYLPVNPVEYHGPHLSLHNDAVVCGGLTRDVHKRLASAGVEGPLLVAADLEVGVDPVPGPGSRPVPFKTVARMVREACLALADLGAQRVVVTTFHGSPMHNLALETGVRALRKRGVLAVTPFNSLFEQIITGGSSEHWERLREVTEQLQPEVRAAMEEWGPKDVHAGLMETSLALHYGPETVSSEYRNLPPCPVVTPTPGMVRAAKVASALGRASLARDLTFAAFGLGWFALRPFHGYTGHPHLASAELGAALADMASGLFADAVLDVFQGRGSSPAPSMTWLRTMTFGGRLERAKGVPATDPLAKS